MSADTRESVVSTTGPHEGTDNTLYYCSFCRKTNREVAAVIAGPNCIICDECVTLCMTILSEKYRQNFTCLHVALPRSARETEPSPQPGTKEA